MIYKDFTEKIPFKYSQGKYKSLMPKGIQMLKYFCLGLSPHPSLYLMSFVSDNRKLLNKHVLFPDKFMTFGLVSTALLLLLLNIKI